MSIDNVKGIRIKQMTEHTASIAVLFFFFFSPTESLKKTSDGKGIYYTEHSVVTLIIS